MNYYEVLGVTPQADAAALKEAYRRLARQLHPDQNRGDLNKAERFKAVAWAYSVLSDPEKRAKYDRLQSMPTFVLSGAADFVAQAGADAIDRGATRAGAYVAQRLTQYGKLGKRAATAAEILVEVGKEWGQGKFASFVKRHG
jgi:curved DNA-binding protein CbpA